MNYKYISGEVLAIDPSSGWTDGTLLKDIYPDSSFVSGNNTDSMQMKPEIKDRKVYAKYSFAKRFEGGPGLVHGGILSAALDDMMGYSTVIHNIFSVTANLSVNFLKPTPVEKEFDLYAWVKEVDNKKVYTEAVIQLDEEIHVESHGMFIDLGLDAAEFFAPDKNYP